jgi:ribosomal-protein-alanine N-acetyltransferase
MSQKLNHPFLVGKKCYLRGLEKADLTGPYFQWFNDQEVTRHMFHGAFPNSEARMQKFFDHVSTSEKDLVLAIIDKKTNKHVGNIGLHHINWIYRTAELGIIIGEAKTQGKGLGTEALQLILNHGFMRLNLHKVYLLTEEGNIAAVKAFEKAGFKKEGLLREDCFRNGKYANSHYMGCLRKDFEKIKK